MKKFLANWNRLEEILAGFAMLVVFLSVVWGVVARYLAPQPSTWSNELATLAFAWVVFIGAAVGARKKMHIGVDLFTALLPKVLEKYLSAVVSGLLGLCIGYMAYLAIKIGIESIQRPTPVLRIPYSVVHASAAIGFGSISIGLIFEMIKKFGSSEND